MSLRVNLTVLASIFSTLSSSPQSKAASVSSAEMSVPPFLMFSPVPVEDVPQAETRTATAARSVDTRNHRDLPIARSIYVNYLPSRQRCVVQRAFRCRIAVIMHQAVSRHQEKGPNINLY